MTWAYEPIDVRLLRSDCRRAGQESILTISKRRFSRRTGRSKQA